MPTNSYVRERLINIVKSRPEKRISRRALLRQFSQASNQFDTQIGLLIADGVLAISGRGTRGNPEIVSLGPNFPTNRCPTCNQILVTP